MRSPIICAIFLTQHPSQGQDWNEVFTGLLVAVGFLQVMVMFLQWCIYRRQALEMRRQRHEMRRQRHVMYRQWKSMQGQLGQMEASGKQTGELVKHAEHQSEALITQTEATQLLVRATIQGVEVGEKTASAALKNAQALINSERPWMMIEVSKPENVPRFGHLAFTAWNRGRTPAEIIYAGGDFFFHGMDEAFESEPKFKPLAFFHRQYVSPGKHMTAYTFDLRGCVPDEQWERLNSEKKYLYFFGRVLYLNLITREEHESRYCYWMSPAPGIGLIMGGGRDWNKHT